jgi:hypothetical protein
MLEYSNAAEQSWQARLQPSSDLLDIHQRHVPDSPFDAAIVSPMQAAPFRSLFLIDLLGLAYATDCAAKTDADVDGHRG